MIEYRTLHVPGSETVKWFASPPRAWATSPPLFVVQAPFNR